MPQLDSCTVARKHASVISRPPLSLEQQMLIRTLRNKGGRMSAHELTNHWTPTWSLQEVQKFMQELVQLGWVQADGRESKVFFISDRTTPSGRKS